MEKMLLSAEVSEGVIHDSGVYRYEGQNQPVDFASPAEGVMALEQVLNVTPGSKVKGAGLRLYRLHAAARRAEAAGRGRVVFAGEQEGEARRQYDEKLLTTEAKVATLIQPDWKWYNARKGRRRRARHEDPER